MESVRPVDDTEEIFRSVTKRTEVRLTGWKQTCTIPLSPVMDYEEPKVRSDGEDVCPAF